MGLNWLPILALASCAAVGGVCKAGFCSWKDHLVTATAICLLERAPPVPVEQQVWSPSSCSGRGHCGSCTGIVVLLTLMTVQLCSLDGELTRLSQLLSHCQAA